MRKSEEYIKNRIISIHGYKYLFDKFNYVSYKENVILICQNHGEFKISLNNLIGNKRGCPVCGKLRSKKSCVSNTEDFIVKAKKVHNNKYVYDNVKYYNWKEKVIIICKEHGHFLQSPNNHLSGSGCPKCRRKRNTTIISKGELRRKRLFEEFLYTSNKIHNFKYCYSEVDYVSSVKKVVIICKKHGKFEQTPHHHKNGRGCPICSYYNSFGPRITTGQFINISRGKHFNYYSYEKSVYTGYKDKIIITCPKHGDFKQNPKYHMNGGGCAKCNIGRNSKGGGFGSGVGSKKLKYTTTDFIKICENVHSFKYDYSSTEYKGSKNKVSIICPLHGKYKVLAYNHMNGIGCKKCSVDGFKRKKIDLVNELNYIHDNKYIYDIEQDYISTSDKIKIICKEHGIFTQSVDVHLRGSGCVLCKTRSRGEILIRKILDTFKIEYIREMSFDSLPRMRFDFWIPKHRTILEYDGKHHFKPIDYFGGINTFNKIKVNDSIKNNWCIDNSIKLIRISYKDFRKIEEIIKKELIENDKLQT